MSFWKLAHGESSDLVPPFDESVETPRAAGAVAALASIGMGLLAARYGIASVPGAISSAGRAGTRALREGAAESDLRAAENDLKASKRRELGCSFLERQVQRRPDAAGLCRLSRARYATGKPNAALEAAKKALELEPSHADAKLLVILYLLLLNAKGEAIELVSKGVPNGGEHWLYHAIADHFEVADSINSMESILLAAVESYPNDGPYWQRLGLLREGRRDYRAARTAYERAHERLSSVELPWEVALQQGKLAATQGRTKDAKDMYERAACFRPEWPELHLAQALLCLKSQDREAAAGYLDDLLKIDSNHAQALFLRANLFSLAGHPERAQSLWERSFRCDRSMPVPWKVSFDEGVVHFRQKHFSAALQEFRSAHELFPEWNEPAEYMEKIDRILRANELVEKGNRDYTSGCISAARQAWQEAVEHDRDCAEAWMKLGASGADEGELHLAAGFFQNAQRLGHPNAHRALSICRAYTDFAPEIGPAGVNLEAFDDPKINAAKAIWQAM